MGNKSPNVSNGRGKPDSNKIIFNQILSGSFKKSL